MKPQHFKYGGLAYMLGTPASQVCLSQLPSLGWHYCIFTFLVACALPSIIHAVILHKSLKSYIAG